MPRQPMSPSGGHDESVLFAERGAAVVALVGRAGAGKSHFASALAAEFAGAQVLAVSDELRAQLAAKGVVATRSELAELGQSWIERAPSRLVELVLAHRHSDVRLVIIDGVRHEAFLEALTEHVRPAAPIVVWIRTPQGVRHARLAAGGMSAEEIAALDKHPTERTIEQWVSRHATRVVDGSAPIWDAAAQLAAALCPPAESPDAAAGD